VTFDSPIRHISAEQWTHLPGITLLTTKVTKEIPLSTVENATSKVASFIEGMGKKVRKGESREDTFTGAIEAQTSKLPSSTFLGLAVGSMAASLTLKIMGKDDWALFVGQWAAPFLIMGNYNKMVKQHGSDAEYRAD
jgi:hypothetical protein